MCQDDTVNTDLSRNIGHGGLGMSGLGFNCITCTLQDLRIDLMGDSQDRPFFKVIQNIRK
jgi:hypothetical protein